MTTELHLSEYLNSVHDERWEAKLRVYEDENCATSNCMSGIEAWHSWVSALWSTDMAAGISHGHNGHTRGGIALEKLHILYIVT